MRVLYLLTDGFGGHGGIAQFNRAFLKAICAFGRTTEVLALPRHVSGQIGELPARLSYDAGAARGKISFLRRALEPLLRKRGFDLIVCAHLNLQPLALLLRRLTGARSILLAHGIEAWTPPANLPRRVAAARTNWVAAVSQLTLDRFAAWSGFPQSHATVLPCSVDLQRFTPGKPAPMILRKYGISEGPVILSVGRLARTERYKGVDELLEALMPLSAREPNITCVIAGSGDDRHRLQRKAGELGIADRVRFAGFVPDADLVHLYRAARVFVLAGYGEGFGIVLLEAMACGIPVVASTLDGSFEAIRGGDLGIAVNPKDQDSLVGGILEALRRPVGPRPNGLDYFSEQAFEHRAHHLLDRAIKCHRSATE